MASSWEGWGSTWSAAAAADANDPGGESDIDYDNITAEVAAEELGHMLVELKLRNALSARQCCVLAFWASQAGAKGLVEKLAKPPDKASGAYSRHFDTVVGCTPSDTDFYEVPLGRRLRHAAVRSSSP